ncbi:dephospho-CoA kinase [bacterium]|nr:dephospho-CoA kinase [bacterium]
MPRFLILGLTGGIASGKSEVGRILTSLGAGVVDSDQVARDVVAPGSDGLEEIREKFGAGVLTPEGELDRTAMREIVFADPAKRKVLESITHPRIFLNVGQKLQQFREEGRPAGVVEAALLMETNAPYPFDAMIAVVAGAETQAERVRARNDWPEAQIQGALAAQLSDDERRERADYIIENFGNLDELDTQTRAVWDRILQDFAEAT